MSTTPPPPSGATIELSCPRCGAQQQLPASAAGTRQTCSACQQTFKVPAAASVPSASTPRSSPAPPPAKAPAAPLRTPPRSSPSTPQPPAPASPRSGSATQPSAPPTTTLLTPPASPLNSTAPRSSPAPPSEVVELGHHDEAPLPFDSLDAPPDSSGAAPLAPPGPKSEESPVDRETFYGAPSIGANRPKAPTASRAPVFIDNKHRVFNDDGLMLVVCGVCGTRVHFKPDKEGTTQHCPDCLIKFVLPKMPPGPEKQPAKRAEPADEVDEFKLQDTFERQGYQPLTRDSVTADLLRGPVNPTPAAIPSQPTSASGFDSTGQVIAPPLPPPFGGAPAQQAPPGPSASLPAPSGAGISTGPSMIDPSSRLPRPPKWAILVSTFEFAFRPLHLLCMLGLTLTIMAPIFLSILAAAAAPGFALILIVGIVPPLEFAPLMFLFSYLVHVVHDSSYGENHVQNWNAVNIVENFIAAIYVFCAIFFAGLPGFLLSLPLAALDAGNLQTILILLSTVLFFPFCLLSLLEEESYWQCYSHEVALSFKRSADEVFLFACAAFIFTVMCLAVIFGIGSIAGEESGPGTLTVVMGFIMLVVVYWAITYARMVGRLAWVMNYEAQFGPLGDDD